MKNWLWLAVAVVIAAFFYLYDLQRLPFEEADEATYAIILREMVANKNFMTTTYNGVVWSEKPPLLFWLMAGSAQLFGFNEFALRFPVALFGILAVIFTALIIKETGAKKETAFIAGLTLIFFPLFLAAARNVRMDVPVTAMILGAVWCVFKSKKKEFYCAGIGVFTALGFLLKSVVALLVLPILCIYGFIYRDWRWVKNKYFWLGITAGAVIALPWHIYEAVFIGNKFVNDYFGFHVVGRFTDNIIQSGITASYIAKVFWIEGQPWSSVLILAFAAFIWAVFMKRSNLFLKEHLKLSCFSIISAVFLTAVFMASQTKLITYFIPAYPFLVLFLASIHWGLFEIWPKNKIIFLRGIMIAIIFVAGYLSFKEAFLNSRLYVSRQVTDAKPIGLYLSGISENAKIFSYEYKYDKTIKYYSGRIIEGIKEEDARPLRPPFYMIIPTSLLEKNLWLSRFSQPYRGQYLTLVFVEE